MSFVHLHFHTSYSLLDGYNPIPKAVARVKELGMAACAITDHNHLGGIPVWQETCDNEGIKPLLGLEGYYNPEAETVALPIEERRKIALKKAVEDGATTEEEYTKMKKKDATEFLRDYLVDTSQYHILFIAKNLTGWKNLVKLQSESARLHTFNGRYLCDMDLIKKYHEGIICSNACIGSYSARKVVEGDYDSAEKYIRDFKNIFGADFYLEIQPLNIEKQYKTNLFYMEMADKYGIKTIATNDVHYTRKEDHDDHDTLLCIGTGKKKSEKDRMRYSNDFWIKSEEEMEESFENQTASMLDKGFIEGEEEKNQYKAYWKEAIKNTNLIADDCEDHIPLGSDKPLIPNTKVPDKLTPEEYLEELSWRGLYRYLSKHPECDREVYEKRLKEELDIINPKGFAPYMLTVREYVNWSNAQGYSTGPGRGSASGSLCLFCIGVTKNIDPIKNGLLFFRFLTKDRKELPDVDVDFPWSHRDDVIHHLEDYHGKDKVAHIGTYAELGVKSGIKDICRVLEVPFLESNNITKAIDEINDSPGVTFKDIDAMKDGDEDDKKLWEKFDALEKKYPEVFRLARAFEGTPRQMGAHASGVLVMPISVTDMVPLRYVDGTAVALWTGPQVEHCGLVKCDVLGLKTLDIIQKTINKIPGIDDFDDLYNKVDIEDKKIYDLLKSKKTEGVFQVESNMMKGIIDMIQPTCFNDLVAIVSLGRPGPLKAGLPKQYGEVKSGKIKKEYPIRGCEDILDGTQGVTIYQEQLMLISKKISGFNDTQADSITRKVLAKKRKKMFPMMIRCHIYGKKNCEGPKGWEDDDHAPWYDPKGKLGAEIPGAIVNGYTEKELKKYFETIEGFSSYCLTA